MNIIAVTIIVGLSVSTNLWANPDSKVAIGEFVKAVKNDERQKVADYIKYPFKRNGDFSIKSKKQFLDYYDIFLSGKTLDLLKSFDLKKLDTLFTNYRGSMILNGKFWFEEGKLFVAHPVSAKEQEFLDNLRAKKATELHPTLFSYENHVMICDSNDYTIRIDRLSKKNRVYRYASWKKTASIKAKPDLLLKGKVTLHGSIGSPSYSFKRGAYSYNLHENLKYGNFDLIVLKQDKEILNQRCIKRLKG